METPETPETPETSEGARELDQTTWRSPAVAAVAAPPSRDPDVLPFHDRPWEDFERAILLIAEHIDGLASVRIYGVRGQSQRGIDLYGIADDGKVVAYQPKRLVRFDADSLTDAVEKFDVEPRPVGSTRLVVCLSCLTDSTEISERLELLRGQHPDIEIEVYDGRRLSEMLRSRPDLVARMFGDAWAAAFCAGQEWPVPSLSPPDVLAEAFVRGPLMALGLADDLESCDAIAEADPARAAVELSRIVDALDDGGYGASTTTLRGQLADLLVRSGAIDEAIGNLAANAWKAIGRGTGHDELAVEGRLRSLGTDHHRPAASAISAFLAAADHWFGQPHSSLEALRNAHATVLVEAPLHAIPSTLFLIETALALDDAAAARELANVVEEVLAEGGASIELLTETRLRVAKADIDHDWVALLRAGRSGRMGVDASVLVLARYGRFCALHGQPEEAEADYQLAINWACQGKLDAEAAAHVRSVVEMGVRYGGIARDVNSVLRLATDVEATGRRLFPDWRDSHERGVVALASNDLPAALRAFRAALRDAVVRGDLSSEFRAHKGLADVLVRAGEGQAALRHAVAVGSTKLIEECGVGNEWTDLSEMIKDGPYWQRAGAFLATSLQADLIPDDRVSGLVDEAIVAAQEPQRSWFSPQVDLNAWKLLAALSRRVSDEQASQLLMMLEPLIERQPNQYRHNDEEHTAIVVAICEHNAAIEETAYAHLIRILEQGSTFAEKTRRSLVRQVPNPPPAMVDRLMRMANDDSQPALDTLGALGIEHPALVSRATEAVDRVMSAPPSPPGTFGIGTPWPSTATRARVLDEETRIRFAEFCADRAADGSLPEPNRADGAEGVALLARHLPTDTRRTLLARMMPLASGPTEPSAFDTGMAGGLHPLSTFRVNLGRGALRREAIQAAALLANDDSEATAVLASAIAILMGGDPSDAHAAAWAIHYLDPTPVGIDISMLLDHPAQWPRQVAAVLAAHQAEPSRRAIERLASDPDPSVRYTLATTLDVLASGDQQLALDIADRLRSDKNWSVRSAAAPPPVDGD